MMRAPTFTPTYVPIHAYKARFSAPEGPNLAGTIGRVLAAGGAELAPVGGLRSAIQALSDDTAGRGRALQDRVALANLVDTHAGLQGGAAVTAQPQALDELDRIKADGQATLASPGMIAAYDQQMAPAIDDAANRINGHAVQQMAVERQAVADQTMQAAQQSAAAAWQDPIRFVDGLGAVHALAVGQAGPEASVEDRANAARAAVGGAVASAVGQALAAGEPEFAAHIVGGWGDTLTPAAYQLAVARLGHAAQSQRMDTIFAQASGGDAPASALDTSPGARSPDTVAIPAPVGAAVYPLAGGRVASIGDGSDKATVRIVHPDGSSATYGGLGLASVAPGDLVTPAHVIGSAGPVMTLAAATPAGDTVDANGLLRSAGGAGTMIGSGNAPRGWDMPTVLNRIAQRQDMSPDDKALAANLAQRRMAGDQAQLANADLAAGRSVVSIAAAAPDSITQAADLPPNLTAQMTPTTLAQVDDALRDKAGAPSLPSPDNPVALRLELMQRQSPGQFAQINLAPLIGALHPQDLAQLAAGQASIAAGQMPEPAQDPRSAVLDAMALHEFTNGSSLLDETLPVIKDQAETQLRLNRIDLSDRPSIANTVSDAIQSQVNPS